MKNRMVSLNFHVVVCALIIISGPLLLAQRVASAKSGYRCPKKFVQCECSQHDDAFSFSCRRPSSKKDQEYTVTFDPKSNEVSLECVSTTVEFFDGMLDPFELPPTVGTVRIYSCPSPNVTYASLLRNFADVTELDLKLETQPLNASLFHNLSALVVLTMEGDNVETVHDTVLRDMAALRNLTIGQSSLETLPTGFFNGTPEISFVDLDNNRLSTLPENTFVDLAELVRLSFSFNQLRSLPADAFRNLTKLKRLSLNNNLLTLVPSSVFAGAPNLERLDLSYNALAQIPQNLFDANPDLVTLNLQNNGNLTILPNETFRNLTKLEELRLGYNNLSRVDAHLLETLTSLRGLHLNNNQLQTIPPSFFKHAANLTEIDLSVNKLVSLPIGVFRPLKKLQFLYLRSNYLADVPDNVFSFMPSLNILILSSNKIEAIAPSAFEGDDNMTALDLSANNLNLTETPFALPGRLHFLNLSHNVITNVPNAWLPTTSLQTLNLSYNNIKAINMEQLNFTSKYVEVDVRMNQIEEVNMRDWEERNAFDTTAASFKTMEVKIFINQNPMKCDCNLLPFIRYLKLRNNLEMGRIYYFEANQLSCSSPPNDLNYQVPLTSVSEETMWCEVRDCDAPCTCRRNAIHRSVAVNCSGRYLVEMIDRLPSNTTKVDLENNHFTSLEMLERPQWDNVTEVYLGQNYLKDIDRPVRLPPRLKLLTLDGNYLAAMPSWLTEAVYARPEFTLTLGNNPWRCDCDSLDLLRLLNSSRQIVNDVNKARCGPGRLQNRRLIDQDVSTLCPPPNRIAATTPVAVMVISTLVLLVVLVVAVLMFLRNRERIKLWFYRRHMCLWMRTEDDIEAGHPL